MDSGSVSSYLRNVQLKFSMQPHGLGSTEKRTTQPRDAYGLRFQKS